MESAEAFTVRKFGIQMINIDELSGNVIKSLKIKKNAELHI